MKLCFFNDWRLGVVKGDSIVDVTDVVKSIPHICPGTLLNGLIADFAAWRGKLEAATGPTVPLAGAKLLPPVPMPSQIDCMAANYMESGTLPAKPAINGFHKSPSAIIGHEGTMVLTDIPATIFEGEAEMAVVIGKKARNVAAADAMSYVFGYINFIDGSARGLPPAGNVFFQMKSRETYAPIGPFLVTADEIPDPHNLDVELTVNGVVKQSFNTSDMAHKIPACIEWASAMHTLKPGDILATGTNHRGLSAFQDGDVVELETKGLGRLRFHVQDDLKRTWGRMTRLERAEAGHKDPEPQLTGKYAV